MLNPLYGVNIGISLQGKKMLLWYHLSLKYIYICVWTWTHTLKVFLPVKVHVNARQSVCFYFPQPLLKKNKGVFSPANKPVFKSDFGKGIW